MKRNNEMPEKCRIIGLTGTIAAGKSTASRYLMEHYGIYAIDADKVGHEALERQDVQKQLIQTFGTSVVQEGKTDRKELGRIVFSDEEKLAQLNEITHPVISRMIREKINTCGSEFILIEAYGLLQSELKDMVSEVWAVCADPGIRLARIIKRQNLSEEEAKKRIASQWSDEEYKKHADIVLDGSGTEEDLHIQCDKVMQ